MNQHTEHTEQSKLISFIRHPFTVHQWPRLGEIFAIPNGAFISKREAAKLQREGVRSGPVDLCLPIRSYTGRFPCLWIEFKRPDGLGKVSAQQTEFMAHREDEGHKTEVVYSATEGVRKVLAYAYGLDITADQAKTYINGALTCP